MITKTTQLFVG